MTKPADAIDGVVIERCFRLAEKGRYSGLLEQLQSTNSDAVVLQYNPFAWGRRGWAPDLVRVMRTFKRARPSVTIAMMFHETYMSNPGWRSWVMRQYQRRQFYQLAALSDIRFFSTGRWAEQERIRRPGANVVHLPVGSNLPKSTADPVVTRTHWGIGSDDFVCGVFGGAHPSRLVSWIERAIEQIADRPPCGRRVVLFHVGGERIDWGRTSTPVVTTGRLSAEEAADAVATMDVLINPFSDGFSTRRTSAIAALQEHVPLLSTFGVSTDDTLMEWNGRGLFLSAVQSPKEWTQVVHEYISLIDGDANAVRMHAGNLYDKMFTWPQIAEAMIDHLAESSAVLATGGNS